MKFKFLLFLVFCICVTDSAWAQRGQYNKKDSKKQFFNNSRIREPLFRWVTGDHTRHGIQVSLGPTYTFTRINPTEERISMGDSIYAYEHNPKGRLGFFGELGMVHITKRYRKYIHYYDWAIGYKSFGGYESTTETAYNEHDSIVGTDFGQANFRNGHLSGRFSVHSVYQINPTLFLDNALGVNLDYSFTGRNKEYQGFVMPETQQFQQNFMAQLHYDIGVGFKAKEGWFIIPGVQLPIITAYEWNNANPSIHWFSSKYYPVLFKVKFVGLFKKDPDRCPPVEINEQDKERSKQFQNR